jgi:hypothetical protein
VNSVKNTAGTASRRLADSCEKENAGALSGTGVIEERRYFFFAVVSCGRPSLRCRFPCAAALRGAALARRFAGPSSLLLSFWLP